MIFQKMYRLLVFAALALCSAHSVAQTAGAPHPEPFVFWQAGHTMTACFTNSSMEVQCGNTEMPSKVGNVKNAFEGRYLSIASSSWIVISENSASLCGFGMVDLKVQCVRIYSGSGISLFDIGSQDGKLTFTRADKSEKREDRHDLTKFAVNFTYTLGQAGKALQDLIMLGGKTKPKKKSRTGSTISTL